MIRWKSLSLYPYLNGFKLELHLCKRTQVKDLVIQASLTWANTGIPLVNFFVKVPISLYCWNKEVGNLASTKLYFEECVPLGGRIHMDKFPSNLSFRALQVSETILSIFESILLISCFGRFV